MKKFLLLCLLALSGCQSLHQTRQSLSSPQGHEVMYRHMPEAKDLAVVVDWPSDWAIREDANPATAYLAAQLMVLAGTQSRSAAEVAEHFSELNVQGYLVPKLQTVRGTLIAKQKNLHEAATLVNSILREPSFDPRWITRVASDRRARQAEASERSGSKAWQTLAYLSIKNQRARQYSLMDDLALFDAIDQPMMQQWHSAVFGSSGLSIAVAGKVNPREALAAVDRLLQGLPVGSSERTAPLQVNFSPRKVLLHLPKVEKSTLVLVAELPEPQGTGIADTLASMILGQGVESRLNKAIRDELRASYGFSATTSAYDRSSRFLYMSGEVEQAKLDAARQAALQAYDDFVRDGPNEAEFIAAKTNVLNHLESATGDSAIYAANEMLKYAERGWNLDNINRPKAELEAMTRESFASYLKNHWPQSQEHTVIAVSADANALLDACVIAEPEQATICR